MNNETDFLPDPADYDAERRKLQRKREIAMQLIATPAAAATVKAGGRDIVNFLGPVERLNAQTRGNRELEAVDAQEALLSANEARNQADFMAKQPEAIRNLAPGLKVPGLRETIAAQIGHEMDAPRRAAEAEAKAIEAGEQRAADRVEKAEQHAAMLADRKEAREQNASLRREIAAMAHRGGDDELNRQLKEERLKQMRNPKLSASQQKAADDADVFLGHIDNAIDLLKANPNSVGLKTMVPDIALQRLDPEGVATRAAVGGLSAEKVHQLSGAAVSAAEFARLRPYLPASGDDNATVLKKLEGLRKEALRIRERHNKGPTDAAPVSAPTGLTVVRTGTRNGVRVEQLSDGSIREVK